MGLDTLYADAQGFELRAECCGPLLQESLAARVCCEEGRGKCATEGGHGHDEPTLARDHARRDELSDAQGRHAVDHNNVHHLLVRGLDEWDGN